MANPEHVAKLKEGVEAWNRWRKENGGIVPNLTNAALQNQGLVGMALSRANLSRARLTGANLASADLTGADLNNANLTAVNLTRANLTGAYLKRAQLIGANLEDSNLHNAVLLWVQFAWSQLVRANMVGVDLKWANLSDVNLTQANMMRAILEGTVFSNCNLTGTIGLESCDHSGPSVIDHRTLRRSNSLPLRFLRGCGLSDAYIAYLPSLLNQPVEFHSCFISYSTKDQEFADRLHAQLQNKGVRCWFAPHDLKSGEKLHEQIDQAIRIYDRLLLILSDDSMNSEWVRNEISRARHRERKENRRMLFPIRLVSFEAIESWTARDAVEISEYFIPDFSNWKDHDSFQKAFTRLVQDLQTQNPPKATA